MFKHFAFCNKHVSCHVQFSFGDNVRLEFLVLTYESEQLTQSLHIENNEVIFSYFFLISYHCPPNNITCDTSRVHRNIHRLYLHIPRTSQFGMPVRVVGLELLKCKYTSVCCISHWMLIYVPFQSIALAFLKT